MLPLFNERLCWATEGLRRGGFGGANPARECAFQPRDRAIATDDPPGRGGRSAAARLARPVRTRAARLGACRRVGLRRPDWTHADHRSVIRAGPAKERVAIAQARQRAAGILAGPWLGPRRRGSCPHAARRRVRSGSRPGQPGPCPRSAPAGSCERCGCGPAERFEAHPHSRSRPERLSELEQQGWSGARLLLIEVERRFDARPPPCANLFLFLLKIDALESSCAPRWAFYPPIA